MEPLSIQTKHMHVKLSEQQLPTLQKLKSLAVQGEVTLNIPQANIQLNGNILEAFVGGSLPLSYEWSDKFGTVLGTS